MTSLETIQDFLSQKRLAVIGVSRNPQDFSRSLFRELKQRGYDAVPVNPATADVEGVPCVPHLRDISPPVEGALLMTQASVTDSVLLECAEAGVSRVWLYRAGGKGAVSPNAVPFCKSKGIRVVEGECPFMFLPGAMWMHRFHGFCRKVMGVYPR